MARIVYQQEAVFEEDDLSLSVLEISRKHGIPHVSGLRRQGSMLDVPHPDPRRR